MTASEVLYQPAPGKPYSEPTTIIVNGQRLQVVGKFIYLANTLSRAVHIDGEVTARFAKSNIADYVEMYGIGKESGLAHS